jgi:hypothetical protein
VSSNRRAGLRCGRPPTIRTCHSPISWHRAPPRWQLQLLHERACPVRRHPQRRHRGNDDGSVRPAGHGRSAPRVLRPGRSSKPRRFCPAATWSACDPIVVGFAERAARRFEASLPVRIRSDGHATARSIACALAGRHACPRYNTERQCDDCVTRSLRRATRWMILEQNQDMRPRMARRDAHRAAEAAEREASVYVRTVLESVRDVSFLATRDGREPWERRSSGSADRLRLRWLMTPPTDQHTSKRATSQVPKTP